MRMLAKEAKRGNRLIKIPSVIKGGIAGIKKQLQRAEKYDKIYLIKPCEGEKLWNIK